MTAQPDQSLQVHLASGPVNRVVLSPRPRAQGLRVKLVFRDHLKGSQSYDLTWPEVTQLIGQAQQLMAQSLAETQGQMGQLMQYVKDWTQAGWRLPPVPVLADPLDPYATPAYRTVRSGQVTIEYRVGGYGRVYRRRQRWTDGPWTEGRWLAGSGKQAQDEIDAVVAYKVSLGWREI